MELSSDHVTYNSLVRLFGMRPGRLELTEQAAEVAKISEAWSVLEIGCGDGRSSLFLSGEYACKVVGIDSLDEMIALAIKRAKAEGLFHRAQFMVADAMHIPFSNCAFDAIICEAVLSGLVDKEKAAEECYRVLKSTGKLVVTDFILRKDVTTELQCQMAALPCAGAKRLEEYINLFEKAGFQDPIIEDHSEEMKRIGCWIALNYGSVAKFFARIAGGMHCRKEGKPTYTPVEVYERFFSQAMFGYALLCLTKP